MQRQPGSLLALVGWVRVVLLVLLMALTVHYMGTGLARQLLQQPVATSQHHPQPMA